RSRTPPRVAAPGRPSGASSRAWRGRRASGRPRPPSSARGSDSGPRTGSSLPCALSSSASGEPGARLGVLVGALGPEVTVAAAPRDQRLVDGAAGEARLELRDDLLSVEEAAGEDVEVRALLVGKDVEAHVALRDHREGREHLPPVAERLADDVGPPD